MRPSRQTQTSFAALNEAALVGAAAIAGENIVSLSSDSVYDHAMWDERAGFLLLQLN